MFSYEISEVMPKYSRSRPLVGCFGQWRKKNVAKDKSVLIRAFVSSARAYCIERKKKVDDVGASRSECVSGFSLSRSFLRWHLKHFKNKSPKYEANVYAPETQKTAQRTKYHTAKSMPTVKRFAMDIQSLSQFMWMLKCFFPSAVLDFCNEIKVVFYKLNRKKSARTKLGLGENEEMLGSFVFLSPSTEHTSLHAAFAFAFYFSPLDEFLLENRNASNAIQIRSGFIRESTETFVCVLHSALSVELPVLRARLSADYTAPGGDAKNLHSEKKW